MRVFHCKILVPEGKTGYDIERELRGKYTLVEADEVKKHSCWDSGFGICCLVCGKRNDIKELVWEGQLKAEFTKEKEDLVAELVEIQKLLETNKGVSGASVRPNQEMEVQLRYSAYEEIIKRLGVLVDKLRGEEK